MILVAPLAYHRILDSFDLAIHQCPLCSRDLNLNIMFLLLVTKLLQPLIPSHPFLIFAAWDRLNKIQMYPPPTLHNCLITTSQHLPGYQAVLGLIQNHSLCSKRITMTMQRIHSSDLLVGLYSGRGQGVNKVVPWGSKSYVGGIFKRTTNI